MCFFLLNHDISYISEKPRWQRSKQINNKFLSQILLIIKFFKLL
jgi:hypothetical protein